MPRIECTLSMVPKVSIIIPCFNGQSIVAEAIQSALDQTYAHVEVIVVDDGSTDDSLAVIQSFGERIVCLTGSNCGACAARNRGIAASSGEYLQFLDADDILHPGKIESQLRHYQTLASNSISFSSWETKMMTTSQVTIRCPATHHEDSFIAAVLTSFTTVAPLYRKALLQEVGDWDESLTCAQDYDLNIRLAAQGVTFVRLNETLLTIRRQASSLSSDVEKVLTNKLSILRSTLSLLKTNGTESDSRICAVAGAMTILGRAAARRRKYKLAKNAFNCARQTHPTAGIKHAYRRSEWRLRNFLGELTAERLIQLKRLLGRKISPR